MIWFLVLVSILLIALGVWGGPRERKRPDKASRIPKEATLQEAWEILTSPVQYEEELIKIPEHRPWYLPGRDRRFHRGLLVGLGLGLLVTVPLSSFMAGREAARTATAANTPPAQTAPGDQRSGGQASSGTEPGQQVGPGAGEQAGQKAGQEAGPQGSQQGQQAGQQAPQQGGQQASQQGGEQAGSQPPANPEQTQVTVTVEPGSTTEEIAATLKAAGLIKDEQEFLRVVAERGVETQLKAGTFVLPSNAGVDQIIAELTR